MLVSNVHIGLQARRSRNAGPTAIEGNRALAERFVTLFPLPTEAF
jgi:hypothetical protein